MTQTLKTLIPLAIVFSLLLATNFIYAAWSAPGGTPSEANNALPPINVSDDVQSKSGLLGLSNLIIKGGVFEYMFRNTSDSSADAGWRLRANDGTGNLNTYINTPGGTGPVAESTGYAYNEEYNPGNGQYIVRSSDASVTAGSPITWKTMLHLYPDGRMGATQYCDENGANCTPAADIGSGGSGGSGGGQIYAMGTWWDNVLSHDINVESVVKSGSGTAWIVTLSAPPTGDSRYVVIANVGSNDQADVKILNPTQFMVQARSSNFNAFLASRFHFTVFVKGSSGGSLPLPVCADGRILKMVSGNWSCVSESAGGGAAGIGDGQTWVGVNRVQGTWYQNTTGRPIMAFHKNIWSGTVVDIGPSQTNSTRLNFQDYDSDLDNGSTFIIPTGHWYRYNTRTEQGDGTKQYEYRELR